MAADTGAPLRRARVLLSGGTANQSRRTTTDLQGRYAFTELAAGRYFVTASKPPYVALQIGQRSPFEQGRPIELGDGQKLQRLDISLPRGGVIAGTVFDDLGEPAAAVQVLALRSQYFEGRRQLIPVGQPATTNDIGQYRLFGLPPGTYLVRTQATSWESASLLDDGIAFAATYYPGSMVASAAQPVSVVAGQEKTNINVPLSLTTLARISGTAFDSRGQSLAGRSVLLLQLTRGPGSVTTSAGMAAGVQPDGAFMIPNVAPGQYVLVATFGSAGSGGRESMSLPIVVDGKDLSDVALKTAPPVSLKGHVEWDGGSPSFSPGSVSVRLHDVGFERGLSSDASTVRDDWSFVANASGAGPFLLRVGGLPADWALKTIYVGDADVTDAPLQRLRIGTASDVRVIITNQVTEVTGAVSDEEGRAMRDCSVVVFAQDPGRWSEGSRFLAAVRPDQDGRYWIRGLPPGEYLAAAVEYLEDGQSEDPEFLESLRARAIAFTLGDHERKPLDMKLVTVGWEHPRPSSR